MKPKQGLCCPAFAYKNGKDCFGHGVCKQLRWETEESREKEADEALKEATSSFLETASGNKPYKLTEKEMLRLFGKRNQAIYLLNLNPGLQLQVDIQDPVAAVAKFKKEDFCDQQSRLCSVCECDEGFSGPVCMDANFTPHLEAPCTGEHYGREKTAYARLTPKFRSKDPCHVPDAPQYPSPPEDPIAPPIESAPIDDTLAGNPAEKQGGATDNAPGEPTATG